MLIFDIETEPLPDDELRRTYTPPNLDELCPHPGLFDSSAVKTGNLKDPAKIEEKIAAARDAHAASIKAHAANREAAAANHFAEFRERAALSATTARVLCIGYYNPIKDVGNIDGGDGEYPEQSMLARFWSKFAECRAASRPMIGLNIHDFDLPFLVRRSWMLGIDVPKTVIVSDRYWDKTFIDLRKVWLCGQQGGNGCPSSFDALAKAFGTPGKPEGTTGKDFAELWHRDRAAAIAYLENDLKQPAEWAKRMGLV